MLNRDSLRELRARVSAYAQPVLSLYVDLYPHADENIAQAVRARVKNALRGMPSLPESIYDRVLARFAGALPQGRSLALFANERELETFAVQARFVDDSRADEVTVRWGKPYLTPLYLLADEHEPYAVLMAHRGSVRVLEVALGGIEELLSDPSLRYVDVPVAIEQPSRQEAEAAEYLSRPEQGARIQTLLEERGIERVIVVGAQPSARSLIAWLPAALQQRVMAVLPDIPEDPVQAHRILELVRPAIEDIEREQERELVARVEERGVVGVDACLRALQDGRLHTIVYPHALHQEVFVDPQTDYVALQPDAARISGADPVRVDLAERLPGLAQNCGARVEFVAGDAERILIERLGGMGGLARW